MLLEIIHYSSQTETRGRHTLVQHNLMSQMISERPQETKEIKKQQWALEILKK